MISNEYFFSKRFFFRPISPLSLSYSLPTFHSGTRTKEQRFIILFIFYFNTLFSHSFSIFIFLWSITCFTTPTRNEWGRARDERYMKDHGSQEISDTSFAFSLLLLLFICLWWWIWMEVSVTKGREREKGINLLCFRIWISCCEIKYHIFDISQNFLEWEWGGSRENFLTAHNAKETNSKGNLQEISMINKTEIGTWISGEKRHNL